jgi:hypothetical protein
MKKKLIILFSSIVVLILAIVGITYLVLRVPDSYIIDSDITFKYQKPDDRKCSAFASYHALSILGDDVTPDQIYSEIPAKNADGSVNCKVLSDYLISKGHNNRLAHQCSFDGLKRMVYQNHPLIVSVILSPDEPYLHYIVVVGFDKDKIYAIDSEEYLANEVTDDYNRKISNSDFFKMWDNGQTSPNIYIRIDE